MLTTGTYIEILRREVGRLVEEKPAVGEKMLDDIDRWLEYNCDVTPEDMLEFLKMLLRVERDAGTASDGDYWRDWEK